MQSSFCMNGDSDGRKNMLELENIRTMIHRSVSARIGLEDLLIQLEKGRVLFKTNARILRLAMGC